MWFVRQQMTHLFKESLVIFDYKVTQGLRDLKKIVFWNKIISGFNFFCHFQIWYFSATNTMLPIMQPKTLPIRLKEESYPDWGIQFVIFWPCLYLCLVSYVCTNANWISVDWTSVLNKRHLGTRRLGKRRLDKRHSPERSFHTNDGDYLIIF